MLKYTNKLPAGIKIKSKYSGQITYLYAINGKAVAYSETSSPLIKKKLGKYAIIHAPSQVISHCFRKAGFDIATNGELYVPIGYKKATGRKTFRGMSLKQIKAAQKKY